MPGIAGIVGEFATCAEAEAARHALSHFPDYTSLVASPFDGVQIAQVNRGQPEPSPAWHRDAASDVSLFLNGTVIAPGSHPRMLLGSDLLQAYLDNSLRVTDYDGSFVLVIVDGRTRQLIIYNDRLATLPCYYHSRPGAFYFSPEAKGIFAALGSVPAYSQTGLVTFLALGYCLGETTLFDGVQCLEPASRVVVDTQTAEYRITRYWQLHFEPAKAYRSRRTAEYALYESILAGHRTIFADPDEQYDMLLSGGWDSRGMLAAAHALGRLPRRSISWGLRDDIPGSDPYLAAQLAEQYSVPHHFISYDTDTFVKNAEDWTYITELNTDNFGWYGEGTDILLSEYAGTVDFIVAGDENWGTGNYVRNREEAMITRFMPAPLPETIRACLSPSTAANAQDIYYAEVDAVLRHCENSNWSDKKDYLYLHGRLARFIFSLGYYKELAVEVRRPFLTKQVLDVVQALPVRMRYGKNLYISTMLRFFPELLNVEKRWAQSLPNWSRDLREKEPLYSCFSELLSTKAIADTGFSELLDLDVIGKASSGFFATPYKAQPAGRDRTARRGRLVNMLKQRVTAYDDVRRLLRLQNARRSKFQDLSLLRRIALLVLLDRNAPRFVHGPPSRLL